MQLIRPLIRTLCTEIHKKECQCSFKFSLTTISDQNYLCTDDLQYSYFSSFQKNFSKKLLRLPLFSKIGSLSKMLKGATLENISWHVDLHDLLRMNHPYYQWFLSIIHAILIFRSYAVILLKGWILNFVIVVIL